MFLERRLQNESTESRIIQFGFDFAKKSKFEVERKFRKLNRDFKLNFMKLKSKT